VGVTRLDGEEPAAAKSDTLPAHIDRVIARLTAMRAARPSAAFDERLDGSVRELDRLRGAAKQARGDARSGIVARLGVLDGELLAAARGELAAPRLAELEAAAEAEIAPFAARMPAEARTRAVAAALDRLIRDAAGLPVVSHEP
jgi:hypothetical protein